MGFDIHTLTLMEDLTTYPPSGECYDWSGLWITVLVTLFPAPQGYTITPRRRVQDFSTQQIPDLIIEVAKITNTAPRIYRTALVVEIKDAQCWDHHGKESLMQMIRYRTDISFLGTATCKVYWIGTIGPHWIFGEKEDGGQDLKPLIGWHDTTHDDESYQDFLQLVELVASL